MRLTRILLSVLLLMVVLVVFAVGSLILLVDPNKLKPTIITTVYQETGIQLAIDGKLSWSFYPRLSIKVNHMRVIMPNQTKSFADLYDVKIATKLSQLWSRTQPLEGEVRIDHLTIMNMQLQDVHVGLHWQNNLLTFAPINADLYQGTLTGVAHVTELMTTPRWDWNTQISNVQLKPLLHDVQETNAKLSLSGTGMLHFVGQAEGKTKEELVRHLNGNSEISVTNGILQGIDINYLVQTADALINKQPLALPSINDQTMFQSLTGTTLIHDGVVTTNDLLLSAPSFTTKIDGTIDLPNESLDLRLKVAPIDMLKIKWMVPVLISGSLNDPSIRLDALALKALIAQEDLQKVKDKVQEQVKQLPKKADKFLKKLLGH